MSPIQDPIQLLISSVEITLERIPYLWIKTSLPEGVGVSAWAKVVKSPVEYWFLQTANTRTPGSYGNNPDLFKSIEFPYSYTPYSECEDCQKGIRLSANGLINGWLATSITTGYDFGEVNVPEDINIRMCCPERWKGLTPTRPL